MSSLRCSWVVIFSGSTEWIRKGSMIVFGLKTIVDMALSLLLFLSPGSSPRLSSSHFVTTLLSESHFESFLTTIGFGWTQATRYHHQNERKIFWLFGTHLLALVSTKGIRMYRSWKLLEIQKMSISLDDSFFIYFFFLIVDLQLWIGILVVVSDFQIALHPIHATIYGNQRRSAYNMKIFSIEKNLLIYSLDNNNKFTKKHVSYFIFSKFTSSNGK